MWRERGRQKDLFDEASPVAELRPDLRNKLAILLRALLVEAAGGQQRQTESAGPDGGKAGDDPDHA
jgi:hypothetical protein